jgi:hypothetical protein
LRGWGLFLEFIHEFPDQLLILRGHIRELDSLSLLADPGHHPIGSMVAPEAGN